VAANNAAHRADLEFFGQHVYRVAAIEAERDAAAQIVPRAFQRNRRVTFALRPKRSDHFAVRPKTAASLVQLSNGHANARIEARRVEPAVEHEPVECFARIEQDDWL
jgi:hypothetical protein